MSNTVEQKLLELTGKTKALNFAIKKSGELPDSTKMEVLSRQITSIVNRIGAVHALKEEIEEIKFTNDESEENVRAWASGIELNINEADKKVRELRQRLSDIEEIERDKAQESERAAAEIERQKQLEFERQKYELEQEAKDEERKRELKHKAELLSQQLEYQKSIEKTVKKPDQNAAIKLPKLLVTKFDGNFANWLPFWNTFQAEVDKSDLPPVTKFAYLKEWLEPKVRAEIEGLPFTTEGYCSILHEVLWG